MAEQNGTNTGKCAEEYVVKRGDSFYLIAHKLGVPLRDLLAANRDIHPARLMVGDVLCVPREEDDSPQTGGLGGSQSGGTTTQTTQSGGTTQTTQATGTTQSGTTQTTQATGTTQSGATTQSGGMTTQTTGTAQSGTTTQSGGMTTQTTQATGTTQSGVTTQSGGTTTQTTGTAQSGTTTQSGGMTTQTTQATGTSQSTGMAQTTQPTCMTGQTAPDTTLSCTEDEQWIVQKGQTVSDLQLRGLVSRHTLETANPGVDLENLSVGQTVCLPTDTVPCARPETYTLAATETLEAVAMRFNLPVASLLRANPCLAPQDFEGGVTVILPK